MSLAESHGRLEHQKYGGKKLWDKAQGNVGQGTRKLRNINLKTVLLGKAVVFSP